MEGVFSVPGIQESLKPQYKQLMRNNNSPTSGLEGMAGGGGGWTCPLIFKRTSYSWRASERGGRVDKLLLFMGPLLFP